MGLASHIGEWHAPNPHRCVRWIRAREGGCARAPLWPGGNGGPLLSLPHSLRPPARSRAASPARSRARSRRGMGWGEGGEKDARALQTETARGRKLKGEQRFPENGCGERREWGLTVFFFLQRGARTPHTPHTSPHFPATMALGRAAKAAIVLLGELKGGRGGGGGGPRRRAAASEERARSFLPPLAFFHARPGPVAPRLAASPRPHWHGTVHVWAPGQWASRERAGLTRPGGAGKLMGLCCVCPRGARRERGGALATRAPARRGRPSSCPPARCRDLQTRRWGWCPAPPRPRPPSH